MVALRPAQPHELPRLLPDAAFVSQLIAARDHLAPQRERRRATPAAATNAYATSARIAIRRLPPGYRTRIDA